MAKKANAAPNPAPAPQVNAPPAVENEAIHLVVVEDDPITRKMIATYFAKEGFVVTGAETAQACREILQRQPVDLVFLDIHLPDGDGLALAQEIRAASAVGIIFVTQNDSEADRIEGLERAGDDYVSKPVNLRELLARSRALLRRRELERRAAPPPPPPQRVIGFGPWLLDLMRREVAMRGGDPIRLTRAEFDLLAALAEAGGRPLSREYLIEVISNRDAATDLRSVDTLVARLRRKLATEDKAAVIVTAPGLGYRLGLAIESDI